MTDEEILQLVGAAKNDLAGQIAGLRDRVGGVGNDAASLHANLSLQLSRLHNTSEARLIGLERLTSVLLARTESQERRLTRWETPHPDLATPLIEWSNLWKAFQGVPGTRMTRFLLTVWELGLWAVCWAGGMWWGWWGLGALGVAFFLHELFFKLWVTKIVGIPVADEGSVVGVNREAVVTLERWVGDTL